MDRYQYDTDAESRSGIVRISAAMGTLSLLREFGFDPGPVLARLGIPEQLFADPESRVRIELIGRLMEECARLTACPHFALLVGEQCRAATLGKLGFAAKYAGTVGTALSMLAANLPQNQSATIVSISARGPQTALGLMLKNPDFVGAEPVIEGIVGWMNGLMLEICGAGWKPSEVQFAHAPRGPTQPYRRIFGCPVQFNAERNALLFASRWLSHQIGHADPELSNLMLRDLTANGETTVTLSQQVRDLLRSAIGNGTAPASAVSVARILGIHSRTLHRRLAAEGTSYRALLDDIRHNVARQMLRESRLSIGQIAMSLGFDEASAFSRAFRRWAGMAPARWRGRGGRIVSAALLPVSGIGHLSHLAGIGLGMS